MGIFTAQRVIVTVAVGQTSGAAAIPSAVDKSRSYAQPRGLNSTESAGTNYRTDLGVPEINAAGDLLTVFVDTADQTAARVFAYDVVQFGNGVATVQHKTIEIANAGSNTVDLDTAIDLARSVVVKTGSKSHATDQPDRGLTSVYLLDGDTVKVERKNSSASTTVTTSVAAIEFASALIQQVIQFEIDFADAEQSQKTFTFTTPVDPDNCITFDGGFRAGGAPEGYIQLDGAGSATAFAQVPGRNFVYRATIVEFVPGTIKRQGFTSTLGASDVTVPNAITAVGSLADAFVSNLGSIADASQIDVGQAIVNLTSVSNVQQTRASQDGGDTLINSIEVIEAL